MSNRLRRLAVWTAATVLLAALGYGFGPHSGQGALQRGEEAFRRQDWGQAENSFLAAVRQDPSSAIALRWLGMAYAAQQQFDLAEPPFRRACEIDPRDELACYYLGRADYAINRFDESRGAFEKALRYHPGSNRIRRGLGLTLEALGLTREAEAYLKSAAVGGDSDALSDYGQFLFRQGRLKESIAVLQRSGDEANLNRALRTLAAVSGRPPVAGPASPIQFSAAELPMVVGNGARGEMHQIETMIAGVAIFDYDNDGWPDIYVANGATSPGLEKASPAFHNRLFRNNHDGTFTDVTDRAGVAGRGYCMGVAVADFDNDGWPDLFVTGVRENILYHNRGDGTFEDVTEKAGLRGDGTWSVAAGWFDYDNDGWLDLFVVRYVKWDPAKEIYCGDHRIGYRAYCHPSYYEPLPNALYHNRGDGTFEDVSLSSGIGSYRGKGMGVAFADYDHDGRMDVLVANDTVPNFLFHNLGQGRFEDVALNAGVAYNGDGRAVSSMGADFRDYDNDGWEDIFLTALSNEGFSLFKNLGHGNFLDVATAALLSTATLRLSGWSTGLYDFDNDGFKDAFTADGHALVNNEAVSSIESRQPLSVFRNLGGAKFQRSPFGEKSLYRGAAFGDLNRDGRIDVVVTQLNGPPLVLTNATITSNHWLRIRLHGRRSNRDGIGARIHVVTDSGSQWNHVTTSVGYGGSSEPEAHFGLGGNAIVRSLEIFWPSGLHQVLRDVAADRRLEIEEPQALGERENRK
jgi:tetratricopeptide (TPR) repeat protein